MFVREAPESRGTQEKSPSEHYVKTLEQNRTKKKRNQQGGSADWLYLRMEGCVYGVGGETVGSQHMFDLAALGSNVIGVGQPLRS
ncbi:hypothetical protein Trydic_g4656 [Trypoxylus dichotomus]